MQKRRTFIKNMAWGTAALYSLPMISNANYSLSGLTKRNSTLNIALIGGGKMGVSDTRTALSTQKAKLVAFCDLYDTRIENARKRWGNEIFISKDYNDILSLKNIDAVIIATPDHWHQKIAIEAMNSGKHVYCEKPVIHKIEEGEKLINTQRRTGKVFEVGSQGMSSWGNKAARELIKNGVIGKVNVIEGQFSGAPGVLRPFVAPEEASEESIWWDRFLGNAPKRPFDAQRFLAWRNWRDYGTTIAGDLFVHVIASVHYIMDTIGPEKVYSTGGMRYYKNGSRDTPDVMLGHMDYPDNGYGEFTLSLSANYVDGISKKWGSTDFKIIGEKGTLDVRWDQVILKTLKEIDAKELSMLDNISDGIGEKIVVNRNEYQLNAPRTDKGAHYNHFVNLFHAIHTDTPIAADVAFGVRASAVALLCNKSYEQNKAIGWNSKTLKVK